MKHAVWYSSARDAEGEKPSECCRWNPIHRQWWAVELRSKVSHSQHIMIYSVATIVLVHVRAQCTYIHIHIAC